MGNTEKFWLTFALQFVIQALQELFKQLAGDDDDKSE